MKLKKERQQIKDLNDLEKKGGKDSPPPTTLSDSEKEGKD